MHIVRVAPKSDVAVLLTCFGLTVVFDMVIAVSVGIVLAALLFMRRMAEVTQARLIDSSAPGRSRPAAPGRAHLRHRRAAVLRRRPEGHGHPGRSSDQARAVILRMEGVPVMDATGLVALESALRDLHKRGTQVYLIGPQTQPRQLMTNAGLVDKPGQLMFRDGLDQALSELQPG